MHPLLHCEQARRRKQMTLADLSKRTKIATFFLSMVESGKGLPAADQAKRLSDALDIPVETLLRPVEASPLVEDDDEPMVESRA